MTYLVILSTYAASRSTDIQQFRDQDGFVAVGSTASGSRKRWTSPRTSWLG